MLFHKIFIIKTFQSTQKSFPAIIILSSNITKKNPTNDGTFKYRFLKNVKSRLKQNFFKVTFFMMLYDLFSSFWNKRRT